VPTASVNPNVTARWEEAVGAARDWFMSTVGYHGREYAIDVLKYQSASGRPAYFLSTAVVAEVDSVPLEFLDVNHACTLESLSDATPAHVRYTLIHTHPLEMSAPENANAWPFRTYTPHGRRYVTYNGTRYPSHMVGADVGYDEGDIPFARSEYARLNYKSTTHYMINPDGNILSFDTDGRVVCTGETCDTSEEEFESWRDRCSREGCEMHCPVMHQPIVSHPEDAYWGQSPDHPTIDARHFFCLIKIVPSARNDHECAEYERLWLTIPHIRMMPMNSSPIEQEDRFCTPR
jgi:hypothetical protein